MKAYHNDPAVKAKYVARFAAHRAADQVQQGVTFDEETRKGCFVGCTLDYYDHGLFPIELGWPIWLAHLGDGLFESCNSNKTGAQFGTDLLEDVPVGADLEPVRAQFLILVQRRNLKRLEGNNAGYAGVCQAAIRCTIELLAGEDDDADWCRKVARGAQKWAAKAAEVKGQHLYQANWETFPEVQAEWAALSALEAASYEGSEVESARSVEQSAWSAMRAAGLGKVWEAQTQREDLLRLLREAT